MIESAKPAPDDSGQSRPFSLDAETSVLGAILLDNSVLAEIAQVLRPAHFYRGAHRTIFDAMLALADRNLGIDLVTIRDELLRRGELERVGGIDAIAAIMASMPSAANADAYGRIVREKAILRQLIDASTEITRDASSCRGEVDELLDRAERAVFAVAEQAETGKPQSLRAFIADSFRQIEAYHKNRGTMGGLATGFLDFDDLTGGLKPSELTIVAARPSMGKTTFALNIALHVGLQLKKTVAIFSLEMAKSQIGQNLISTVARADVHKVRKGELPEADWHQLVTAAESLFTDKILIDDTPALTPLALKAKARRIRAEHGLDLVIVDYLQLMECPTRAGDDTRQQEISIISRSLKALARELAVPVIAISQLNRAVDNREGNRPRMSDLRESGAIEQDADLVLFLYRGEYYAPTDENRGVAEVIVAKHRNGPTGTVRLHFQPEFLRFGNLATRMPGT